MVQSQHHMCPVVDDDGYPSDDSASLRLDYPPLCVRSIALILADMAVPPLTSEDRGCGPVAYRYTPEQMRKSPPSQRSGRSHHHICIYTCRVDRSSHTNSAILPLQKHRDPAQSRIQVATWGLVSEKMEYRAGRDGTAGPARA